MILPLTRTLAVILALGATVWACSIAEGAVDDTPERIRTAFWIFFTGIFVLVVHGALFLYRAIKKKEKSHWVFWSTVILSVCIIPIVLFLILMSMGTACGIGASSPPTYLLIFEFICLVAQLISWKFSSKPKQSLLPLD